MPGVAFNNAADGIDGFAVGANQTFANFFHHAGVVIEGKKVHSRSGWKTFHIGKGDGHGFRIGNAKGLNSHINGEIVLWRQRPGAQGGIGDPRNVDFSQIR